MTGADFNLSEQQLLSIRLSADGFSFSTCHTPVTGSIHTVSFPVNESYSMTANLKEMIASNDALKVSYQRVNVLVETPRYTILPFDLYEDEQTETIFYQNFRKKDNEIILCNILSKNNIVVLFGMDKHAHQLLNEQYSQARFFASVSPMAEYFIQENRKQTGRSLYAHLHKNAMDLFAFDRGKLLLLNTISCKQLPDRVYYLLYVWQQLGFHPEDDQLYLAGKTQGMETLTDELRKFIRKVETPTDDSPNHPSFDMQTLLICE